MIISVCKLTSCIDGHLSSWHFMLPTCLLMKMFHLSVHLLFLVCNLGGCWRKPEPLTRPFFRSPVGRVFLAYSVTVDLDDSADWYLTEYTQWAFFVFSTCMMSQSAQYFQLSLSVFEDDKTWFIMIQFNFAHQRRNVKWRSQFRALKQLEHH